MKNLEQKVTDKESKFLYDATIIGGLGHVGLPLGLMFAYKNLKVCLLDSDEKKAKQVKKGIMPFIEYGAEPILREALDNKNLKISLNKEDITKGKNVVITLGTPIDEYLNPKTRQFLETMLQFKDYLSEDQTTIIRSTVYPNTCKQLKRQFKNINKSLNIAYCPERTTQGYFVKESLILPQIVAGLNKKAVKDATNLFKTLSPKIIYTSIKEAELIKLFSNAWRYIKFATTNKFYMISKQFGADYNKIRHAMIESYERAVDLPGPGFASGPCLRKDTMQLSSFDNENFLLGYSAMMVNEGLPNFIVENLKKRCTLNGKKVGILGMAFKANIDDVRDSLSFKLGKILKFNGAKVYYSDEFAKDPDFISREELIRKSDIIVVGVPHSAYKGISIPYGKKVVDLWNILEK